MTDPARIPRFCFNCGTAVIAERRSCLRCNSWLVPDADATTEVSVVDADTEHVRGRAIPADALPVGQRLCDRYEIEAVDSVGRLHVCYRAFDTVLERTVTLRTLASRERSAARRAELRHQARLQNALDHPNIVRTLDFIEDVHLGVAAVVEEYSGTRNLRAWLDLRGAPTQSFIEHALYRHLMLPLAAALAYAHRHGVVHRNLKPGKIFLDRYDQPRITDFGLGNYALPTPVAGAFTAIVGTLEYMAPEQASEPRSSKPAGDLYALGVIFYELVSGRLPICGENDLDFLNKLMKHPPTPLIEVAPHVPPGLDAVIMRCLEKLPVERYASADELYLALAEVLGHPSGGILA